MRLLLVCCLLFAFTCLSVQISFRGCGRRRQRKLVEGDGLNFPRRLMSIKQAETCVFNRDLYVLYRLANPLIDAEDLELRYENQTNGDVLDNWVFRLSGDCVSGTTLLHPIPEECNKAAFSTDGPFPTTGEIASLYFFSSHPKDYFFAFVCLDSTKEIVRHGRRVFCNGPFEMVFAVYEFPPDRVKWYEAEYDLWKNFCLTFDTDLMRFEPSGQRCPTEDDDDLL